MSVSTIAKDETWQEKLVRRFKEEPLVPLGTLMYDSLGGQLF